jgi:hypothetical protein
MLRHFKAYISRINKMYSLLDDINPGIVPENETENESQYVRIEQ